MGSEMCIRDSRGTLFEHSFSLAVCAFFEVQKVATKVLSRPLKRFASPNLSRGNPPRLIRTISSTQGAHVPAQQALPLNARTTGARPSTKQGFRLLLRDHRPSPPLATGSSSQLPLRDHRPSSRYGIIVPAKPQATRAPGIEGNPCARDQTATRAPGITQCPQVTIFQIGSNVTVFSTPIFKHRLPGPPPGARSPSILAHRSYVCACVTVQPASFIV